jgi:hypothetical protein
LIASINSFISSEIIGAINDCNNFTVRDIDVTHAVNTIFGVNNPAVFNV